MGFTVNVKGYDAPGKYPFHVALVDIARRNGGVHGNIGVDFVTDRIQCHAFGYIPADRERTDSVRYSSIGLSGNDLVFNGQFVKDGAQVSDKVNLIYLSVGEVNALWKALSDRLKTDVGSAIAENRNAPEMFSHQLQADIYSVSADASKEKIRFPYAGDFAGDVTWSKGFNFEKPVQLSNGIRVTGIRAIDFSDCTLFGAVTADRQHFLLRDLVRGRDCEPFGKAVKENVDKILNNTFKATIKPVGQKRL